MSNSEELLFLHRFDYKFATPDKCRFEVEVRDTYRLVRGRGFKMHFNHRQCRKKPLESGYCKGHEDVLKRRGIDLSKLRHAKEGKE